MLLAGLDTSGDRLAGNRKFMGVVIGTSEGIRSAAKDLGDGLIHMSAIRDRRARNAILAKVRFDNNTTVAFCIRLDKDSIVGKIHAGKKSGHRYPKKRIMDACDYILRKHIQADAETFFAEHGHAVHEVVFQCDDDCADFVKSNGLTRGDPGDAHMLADIVAWSNNRGKELAGVKSVDIRARLETELKKRFGG